MFFFSGLFVTYSAAKELSYRKWQLFIIGFYYMYIVIILILEYTVYKTTFTKALFFFSGLFVTYSAAKEKSAGFKGKNKALDCQRLF